MTKRGLAGQVKTMDIKLHPDAKKLLDEINSRRRGHIVEAASRRGYPSALRKGGAVGKDDQRIRRADIAGRGGPL